MSLATALAADRECDLPSAARAYEEAIASGDQALDVLLSLALLYWQATDPGLASTQRLTSDFLAIAGKRYVELLDLACRLYPTSSEAHFWKQYVEWTDLGGVPIDAAECRRMLHTEPSVLIPAMHLFVSSQGKEAALEAEELLRQCRERGTTGARYVVSVLEGVMRRRT